MYTCIYKGCIEEKCFIERYRKELIILIILWINNIKRVLILFFMYFINIGEGK